LNLAHVAINAANAKLATSAWHEPVNAVSKATGLDTTKARAYLETLRNAEIILPFSIVVNGNEQSMFQWAKPPADYFWEKTPRRDLGEFQPF
jgi:hypothetical protein